MGLICTKKGSRNILTDIIFEKVAGNQQAHVTLVLHDDETSSQLCREAQIKTFRHVWLASFQAGVSRPALWTFDWSADDWHLRKAIKRSYSSIFQLAAAESPVWWNACKRHGLGAFISDRDCSKKVNY